MKYIDIKAGSICLYKSYGFFKKLLAKLLHRKLPFNRYMLYYWDETTFVGSDTKDNDQFIILEPIKPYSKLEKAYLKQTAMLRDCPEDLFEIINVIRPDTIDTKAFNIPALLQNRYFKVAYDSNKSR